MSNALAVATVTAALQVLLDRAARSVVAGAGATTLSPAALPERIQPAAGVNVWLFLVRPNVALSNADLPRVSGGRLTRRPQVALDLDYLLTFFGKDEHLEPQRILGAVVSTLHAEPLLSVERTRSLAEDPPPGRRFLAGSDLHTQDPVRLERIVIETDEMHRLWALFGNTPYQLSLVYRASVVLIDAEVELASQLPALGVDPGVTPLGVPWINAASAVARAGEALELRGLFPTAPSAVVLNGRVVPAGSWLTSAPGCVDVTLVPELIATARLSPGPVQVALRFATDAGELTSAPAETRFLPAVASARASGASLEVTLVHPVDPARTVRAMLDPVPPARGKSAALDGPPRSGWSTTLTFSVPPWLPPGAYLLRVEVAGAQSELELRRGRFAGPVVEVQGA